MAIDTSSVQTFTLEEHLNMVENAIANLMMGGQQYVINGRSFTRADLDKLRQWRAELKAEVEIEDTPAGGIAVARFNRHT